MRAKFVVMMACAVLSAGSASAQVDYGAIGVAWDPAGEVCNLSIGIGTDATLYILAYPSGIFAGASPARNSG